MAIQGLFLLVLFTVTLTVITTKLFNIDRKLNKLTNN